MLSPSRVFADRRTGTDRRVGPRRVAFLPVADDRRRIVDLRKGRERRSTLDRRVRVGRSAWSESPAEHIRNALQLLAQAAAAVDVGDEPRADLGAALLRLERALFLLERR